MNTANSDKQHLWTDFVSQNHKLPFTVLLNKFREIYTETDLPIVWTPEKYGIASNISSWMSKLRMSSYADFYQWSVENKTAFWETAVKNIPVVFDKQYSAVLEQTDDPDEITWFKDAAFNIVDSCFQAAPTQTAIYFQAEGSKTITKVSYQELRNRIRSYAAGFIKQGFAAHDRVVIYLPFSIEAIAVYLGLIYMGAEPVLVSDSFSAAELKKRIDIIHAKAVLTIDAYVYAEKTIPVINKVIEANPATIILHTTDKNAKALAIRNNNSDLLLSDLETTPADTFTSYKHSSKDIISILFSSGTTKEPKALPWLATTPIKCATDGKLLQDIHEGDVVTWTSGMGWMMAPWLIFASLLNKASIAVYNGAYSKKEFIDFTVQTKVTVLGTIPSVVKSWRAQQFEPIADWHVRIFSSTGEPSDTEDYLYLCYLNSFKAPIIEYCGGTEIGGGYLSSVVELPNALCHFNTPAPGSALILVDADKNIITQHGTGEVFLIPPTVGLSQQILNKNHHEEYYSDLPEIKGYPRLRKHGDGYTVDTYNGIRFYKSTGRTDDTMNLGGIKISAVEIEAVVNKHAAVFESAAVAYQEANGGPEKLALFVQTKQQIDDTILLQQELQKIIQAQLNPLFRISMLILKQSFPRTASNKLMRKDLRKEITESLKKNSTS